MHLDNVFARTGAIAALLTILLTAAGAAGEAEMTLSEQQEDFARRYAAAWSSQDPASVAAFFAEDATLTINGGEPSVGREGITEAARSFMTGYPDMVVTFDKLEERAGRILFHWTFDGHNTGSGGTGNRVRISGFESWLFGPDSLVAESLGTYDAAEWDRQVAAGYGN